MCGITGIWSKKSEGKVDFSAIQPATDSLKHRGPDHIGIKRYTNCALGHTRLSIIDCDERSNQPFLSDDERYGMVFNGEIYNFLFLREKLEELGVSFKTVSDTEVLLHQLMHYGVEGLKEINGFFALAFYDQIEERLILARDSAGIKPLLVAEDKHQVCFASEMSAIEAMIPQQKLNVAGINQYFALTYSVAPDTIFKEVEALKPGEVRVYDSTGRSNHQIHPEKRKTPTFSQHKMDYDSACKEVKHLLTESVKLRMVSDVPLGTFLSGGLDSSIISAIARQLKPDLETFSVGFDHPYFNETDYSDEVAKHIDSRHTKIMIGKEEFRENFSRFLKSLDQPFADSSAFAMFLLAERTSEKVTVALSGDGADELFGGYRKHLAAFHMRHFSPGKAFALQWLKLGLLPFKSSRSGRWGDLKRKVNRFDQGRKMSGMERYWHWCQFIPQESRKALLQPEMFAEIPYPFDWEQGGATPDLLADQQLVLPNDMLKKVDMMSMAHGLEVRTPFLDTSIITFANALPEQFMLNRKGGKRILKDGFKDLLPLSVINRSKKGFEIPLAYWLKEELAEQLNGDLFTKQYIEEQRIFNGRFIEELKKETNQALEGDQIFLIWSLIIFQNWWERRKKT